MSSVLVAVVLRAVAEGQYGMCDVWSSDKMQSRNQRTNPSSAAAFSAVFYRGNCHEMRWLWSGRGWRGRCGYSTSPTICWTAVHHRAYPGYPGDPSSCYQGRSYWGSCISKQTCNNVKCGSSPSPPGTLPRVTVPNNAGGCPPENGQERGHCSSFATQVPSNNNCALGWLEGSCREDPTDCTRGVKVDTMGVYTQGWGQGTLCDRHDQRLGVNRSQTCEWTPSAQCVATPTCGDLDAPRGSGTAAATNASCLDGYLVRPGSTNAPCAGSNCDLVLGDADHRTCCVQQATCEDALGEAGTVAAICGAGHIPRPGSATSRCEGPTCSGMRPGTARAVSLSSADHTTCCISTSSPTLSPTASPSSQPTALPSALPSSFPTVNPTTVSPTVPPTAGPTQEPSGAPTAPSPSAAPIEEPPAEASANDESGSTDLLLLIVVIVLCVVIVGGAIYHRHRVAELSAEGFGNDAATRAMNNPIYGGTPPNIVSGGYLEVAH